MPVKRNSSGHLIDCVVPVSFYAQLKDPRSYPGSLMAAAVRRGLERALRDAERRPYVTEALEAPTRLVAFRVDEALECLLEDAKGRTGWPRAALLRRAAKYGVAGVVRGLG